MKRNISVLLPLVLIALIISCAGNMSTDHVYFMTTEKAIRYGKTEIDFKISYPDSITARLLEDGQSDNNYIIFLTEKIDETLSIGSVYGLTGTLELDEIILSAFIDKVNLAYVNADLSNYEVNFSGKKDFCGKEVFQFECSYEILDDRGNPETWMDKCVLLPNGQGSGVSLAFQANDKSEFVHDFSDLGEVGPIGEIWKTFEFID